MTESEEAWRRLEPASLVVNLVPTLWRTLRSMWYLLVPLVVGGSVQGVIDLGFLGLFFFLAVARTVAHYATLKYRMQAGKLEIVTGLIGQRYRIIDPARIQNLEIVQNLFHRLAGLVELRVETAGEAGAEGMLSAISVAEAERLRGELEAARRGGKPVEAAAEAPVEEVGRVGLVEVIGYGMSAGRVGATVLAISVVLDALSQFGPAASGQVLARGGLVQWAGLLLTAVAVAYASAVGRALLRFFNFRVVQGPRGVATESGLFTRRRLEIPPNKVQVLRVEEPLVRRLMGYATVQIETAASGMPGETGSADAMIPMVADDDVPATLGLVLPGLPEGLWTEPMRPAAPRALLRALIGATMRWGALVVGLYALGWGAWPLLFLAWGWIAAWIDWRSQGWRLVGDWLVSRRGFPTRRTFLLPLDKVQSVHRVQGPLMRRHRLGRVVLWVAGARVTLPDLHEADAVGVFEAISGRWAR